MTLLGIDIGTTNCKAGLFREDGAPVRIVSKPAEAGRDGQGYRCYEPEKLWRTAAACIREAVRGDCAGDDYTGHGADGRAGGREQAAIAAIGIASMAESGLLVDAATGQPRTPVIPWFDMRAAGEAEWIGGEDDPVGRFRATGLHANCKYGLAKLVWLRKRDPQLVRGAVWLSAADYIAYRLTGMMATDYSLAGRTYAFDIRSKSWDLPWISHFGLEAALFPPAYPSGAAIGRTSGGGAAHAGLSEGVPVAIAGHDHVAAALAVGAAAGDLYDSIGTAETLVGLMEERPLTKEDFATGLSYGLHSAAGLSFWMGGMPAAGGSVEWMRAVLGERGPLGYGDVVQLLAEAAPGPTGIAYFPYLSGSGAPRPDSAMRGAWIGLGAGHGRADLMKAALEGTAFEMEAIRRAARHAPGSADARIIAVGGGTRIAAWMSIKADVSGCPVAVPAVEEATLLGAALSAGIGAGVYGSAAEAAAVGRIAAEAPSDGAHEMRPDEPNGARGVHDGPDGSREMRPDESNGAHEMRYDEPDGARKRSKPDASRGTTLYKPDPERHAAYRNIFERTYMPLQQPLRTAYRYHSTKELGQNDNKEAE